jgi:hypothetical protein
MNERAPFIKHYEKIKNFSYEDFKWNVNIVGHISFKIIYFCYGFLQFLATWSGFVKVFHHDNIIIQLASFVFGFIPLIGTGFGIFGAVVGWGWSLSQSILIFFIIPYFIVNGPLLMIGFYDIYKDCKRWQSEKN